MPIGAWVLKQACIEAVKWPNQIKVAVNLSPVQFKSDKLVFDVVAALAASGLAPQRLELEITETIMLQETETTLAVLRQIKALGVAISMDDFGTGYSSLSYLRKFPFDKIKIDQSFIRELSEAHESVAIVRAVMGLGTSLGMVTMAEGVETREQLRTLQAEGCAEAQGFCQPGGAGRRNYRAARADPPRSPRRGDDQRPPRTIKGKKNGGKPGRRFQVALVSRATDAPH